jgi:predicted nucleic-acid-binding protein
MKNMQIVDANIILRYLLDDHPELSPKAAEILEQQTVTLPLEVACEVVYVLQRVYAVERRDIQQQLSQLIDERLVAVEKANILLTALECYSTSTLNFVDTLLLAYHRVEQHAIFTFDHKLNKQIQRSTTASD